MHLYADMHADNAINSISSLCVLYKKWIVLLQYCMCKIKLHECYGRGVAILRI